jgi:4-hydroxy-3-methylbut-2-enyl diphosphate reductase
MLLAILIPITPLGSLLKAISPLGFVLTLCPIYILIIFYGYKTRYLLPGIRLEFLMDTQFVMAGLFAFF